MKYEQSEISDNTGNKSRRIFAFVFGIVAITIYFTMGILLIFTNVFSQISQTMRIIFGTVLMLYGFYRGYRAVKR
jgi:cytochrome c biogenesis protein CcdA